MPEDAQSILAFGSQAEALQWLLTAFHEHEQRIIKLEKDNTALEARINLIEENVEIQASILAKLKDDKLRPAQQDRAEILRALLAANGGKMFAKDARQKMRLSKATFSVLLSKMEDEISKKPYHLKKNQIIISLK